MFQNYLLDKPMCNNLYKVILVLLGRHKIEPRSKDHDPNYVLLTVCHMAHKYNIAYNEGGNCYLINLNFLHNWIYKLLSSVVGTYKQSVDSGHYY